MTPAIALHAQEAAIVYRLGHDTVAVEQFTRTPTRFSGETVVRSGPAVSRTQYDITLAGGKATAIGTPGGGGGGVRWIDAKRLVFERTSPDFKRRTIFTADLTGAVKAASMQILDDLNSTHSFVTLFHLKLTTEDGLVQYVDAGHGFAVLVRRDGTVQQLRGDGLPLGVVTDDEWVTQTTRLEPGDSLVVASDGMLDLVGDGNDLAAALEFVARHPVPADLCAQARALASSRSTSDDITIVAIRRDLPP